MNTLLDEVTAVLDRGGIANARGEAARIIETAQSSTQADHAVDARAMAERRAAGAPLAYVTGHEMFMGVELIVAEGALAPREETELLGNAALDALRSSGSAAPRVIDMCCGSGNLACAIAYHLPHAHVWASDLTDGCIAVTRRNVVHVGVSDRVVVAQGDLFADLAGLGLEGTIDAVVCTPPTFPKAISQLTAPSCSRTSRAKPLTAASMVSASSSASSRRRYRFCGPVAYSSSRSASGRSIRSRCCSTGRRPTKAFGYSRMKQAKCGLCQGAKARSNAARLNMG